MELWSLMHFLMPHVFRSRKEFQYWFSSPLTSMVGGERAVADDLVRRLHSILRPFVLRRLKRDVREAAAREARARRALQACAASASCTRSSWAARARAPRSRAAAASWA